MAIISKQDLINIASESANVTKKDAQAVTDALLDGLVAAIKRGDEVRITGVLSASVIERKARNGRNPRTGESLVIPASKAVKIKAGSVLKEAAAES